MIFVSILSKLNDTGKIYKNYIVIISCLRNITLQIMQYFTKKHEGEIDVELQIVVDFDKPKLIFVSRFV